MKYAWQTAYENAMFEKDPAKRSAQIESAETVMRRQSSLSGNPDAFEERKALQTAIARVRGEWIYRRSSCPPIGSYSD